MNRLRSDPFGNPLTATGNTVAGHGFLNKPVDRDTDLTLLGARFYDTEAGAFLNPDPLLVSSGCCHLAPAERSPRSGNLKQP